MVLFQYRGSLGSERRERVWERGFDKCASFRNETVTGYIGDVAVRRHRNELSRSIPNQSRRRKGISTRECDRFRLFDE
jgi:hypothetical protein